MLRVSGSRSYTVFIYYNYTDCLLYSISILSAKEIFPFDCSALSFFFEKLHMAIFKASEDYLKRGCV